MKKNDEQTYQFLLRLSSAAGIDVHKEFFQVAVCREKSPPVEKQFGTFSKDLLALRDFLNEHRIKDVIMESTGVYWMPLYNVLTESGINVRVANPLKVKQIPMEKTDKKDAVWLAKLLMNDMVKPSFIPDQQQQAMRSFSRLRTKYTQQTTRVKNQVVKVLETCNFKIRSIVSDISTKTAGKLVEAISKGETDIDKLIALCHSSVRKRQGDERLALALEGRLTDQNQQLLIMLLKDLAYFEGQKKEADAQVKKLMNEQQQTLIDLLDEVEGTSVEQAEIVMAEIGAGIESFPHADKAAKYGGLTSGQATSADNKKPVRAVPGNKHLRTVMVQIAWSAVKVKGGYWAAEYQTLKKRIGAKKAILATARKIFKAMYKILTTGYKYEKWDAKRYYDNRIKTMAYKTALQKAV
jgi:transposase